MACGCSGSDKCCAHCRCAACGASTHSLPQSSVLRCAGCRRVAHASCVPAVPFYCSAPCRFGVTIQRNAAFSVPLSARLELKCERLWEATPASDVVSYRRLRHRLWAEYFELQKHKLPRLTAARPIPLGASGNGGEMDMAALLSPEGQAALLCALHPLDHPVGSAVAVPGNGPRHHSRSRDAL